MNKSTTSAESDCCTKGMRPALTARFTPRPRTTHAAAHPQMRGDRKFLRALRAAEMAAWEASLPLNVAGPFAEAVAHGESHSGHTQLAHSFGTFLP